MEIKGFLCKVFILLTANIINSVTLVHGPKHLKFISEKREQERLSLNFPYSHRLTCEELELLKLQKPKIFAKPLLQSKKTGILLRSQTSFDSVIVRITCVANYPITLTAQKKATSEANIFPNSNLVSSMSKGEAGETHFKLLEVTTSSANLSTLLFKCSPESCSRKELQSLFEISVKNNLQNYPPTFNETVREKIREKQKNVIRDVIYVSLLVSFVFGTYVVFLVIRLLRDTHRGPTKVVPTDV